MALLSCSNYVEIASLTAPSSKFPRGEIPGPQHEGNSLVTPRSDTNTNNNGGRREMQVF